MSLFQCDRCGACENTALSNYHHYLLLENHPEVLASYRAVLCLPEDMEYGQYCSACSPEWHNDDGSWGVGPAPEEKKSKWHGQFERTFLPKGMFHTDENGNLSHIKTLDDNIDKYKLESEDRQGLFTDHPEGRLPRPGSPEAERYLKIIKLSELPESELTRRKRKKLQAAQMIASMAAMMPPKPYMPRMHSRREPEPLTPEEIIAQNARAASREKKAQEKRIRKENRRHSNHVNTLIKQKRFDELLPQEILDASKATLPTQ